MKKILLLLFIMLPNIGFCAEEGDLQATLKQSYTEPNFLSVLIALLFVVALIYITGFIYTKLNILSASTVKKQFKNKNFDKIIVLSTTQLGQNKNLHIIEIDNKKFLLGATPNSISLIKELGENDIETEFSSALNNVAEQENKEDIIKPKTLEELFDVSQKEKQDLDKKTEEIEDFGLYKKYLKED